MTATTAEATVVPARAASPAYRRYVVWLLFVIAIFNFFDRQVVNILAEHIKRDLGLADWQLGLLTGVAFAALYTIFGIPVALLADRWNRSRIISISLAAWSLFTALCGLAQSFSQLLLARVAVGMGESGCQPPSHALISAYTDKTERSRAMGIYALAVPAGSLLALVIGGILSERVGWRATFLIAGVPGIALALLAAFTLRDPPRPAGPAVVARSIGASFKELRANPAFWWMSLGSASMAFVSYGQLAFFGSFFLRVHKPGLAALSASVHDATGLTLGPTALVGTGLGLIVGISGLIGAWLGGALGHKVAMKRPGALMWVPAITAPLCLPFYIAAFFAPSAPLALLLLFPPKLLGSVWIAPTFAALQSIVEPDNRATASAVHSSVVLMFGLGLGPVGIGLLSDAFARNLGPAEGVRWALVCASFMCALAAILFTVTARRMKSMRLT